jgi:hypothetical protein
LNKIFIDFGKYPVVKKWQLNKMKIKEIENSIIK